jgi:hypothetical protein
MAQIILPDINHGIDGTDHPPDRSSKAQMAQITVSNATSTVRTYTHTLQGTNRDIVLSDISFMSKSTDTSTQASSTRCADGTDDPSKRKPHGTDGTDYLSTSCTFREAGAQSGEHFLFRSKRANEKPKLSHADAQTTNTMSIYFPDSCMQS